MDNTADWRLQGQKLLWHSRSLWRDIETLNILTIEARSTASFHPPHSDSQCSPILFRWQERLLQQQDGGVGGGERKGKEIVNHTGSAVAQRSLCATQRSASRRETILRLSAITTLINLMHQ